MDIKFEKTKKDILEYCIEDWTSLFFILSFVEQYYLYKDQELIKKTSLEIIKTLLKMKLVLAGDVTNDNKFISWKLSLNETINRIKSDWDNLGRELHMYELVWFDITEKGKKELERLQNVPELQEYIYYWRTIKGGQKEAQELLNKLTNGVALTKNDHLRKCRVYKLSDDTVISFRKQSKFNIPIIDIHFSGINKNLLFKFTKKRMNIKFLKTKYKFLMWCMEDYTSLFSLMCFVKEFYKYNEVNLLKITTLELVQDMLEEGFIDVGLLNDENIFEPSDKNITEVLKEIRFQWDNLDRSILPHEIAWFNVTIKGIIEYERLRSIPEVIEVNSFYIDSSKI